jgi:hypothetical protein
LIYLTWTQVEQDIDGENYLDRAGAFIAMSADGNWIAIGAAYNGLTGSGPNPNRLNGQKDSASVLVYDYNGLTWTQVGAYTIDGGPPYDESGQSITMSADGNRIAIGAVYKNNN